MSEQVFTSSRAGAWTTWLGALILGALMLVASISIVGGDNRTWFVVVPLVWGVYNLGFAVRAWGKIADVAADQTGLTINFGGTAQKYEWQEVQSCSRVRFEPVIWYWHPRFYQVTFKSSNTIIYFVPGASSPRPQGLWETHYNSLMDIIEHKIREARAESGHAI